MCYARGNNYNLVRVTSRFGSVIQPLPSDIREYFKLSFITVVIVFISIFHIFSLLYSEITFVIYISFVGQKYFFDNCRILLSEIKFIFFTHLAILTCGVP